MPDMATTLKQRHMAAPEGMLLSGFSRLAMGAAVLGAPAAHCARGIQEPDAGRVARPHSPHRGLELAYVGDACRAACPCTA